MSQVFEDESIFHGKLADNGKSVSYGLYSERTHLPAMRKSTLRSQEDPCSSNSNNPHQHFVSSLISRIKSVDRLGSPSRVPLLSDRPAAPQTSPRSTLEQVKQLFSHKARMRDLKEVRQQATMSWKQQCGAGIEKLQSQNRQLKKRIQELEKEKRQQKRQLLKSQSDLAEKDRLLKEFEEYLEEREEQHQAELDNLCSKIELLEKSTLSEWESAQHILADSHLGICATVDEVYMPPHFSHSPQTLQLKHQLQQVVQTCSQLKREKEEEMGQMRRAFRKNLNHYKELLLKCTAKSQMDFRKKRDELLDTTILEPTQLHDPQD